MVRGTKEGGSVREEGKNVRCHYSRWGRDCQALISELWSCHTARTGTRMRSSLLSCRVNVRFLERGGIEGVHTCAKGAATAKERVIPRHGYGQWGMLSGSCFDML